MKAEEIAKIAKGFAEGKSPGSETANMMARAIYTAIAVVFDEAAKRTKSNIEKSE